MASDSVYLYEQFSDAHKPLRDSFDCGVETLNEYLRHFAGQDLRNRVAVPFVMVDEARLRILGYYTLSGFSIKRCDLPESIATKLPQYPRLPETLIGRLAVDKEQQGAGVGRRLLMNALERSLTHAASVASMAVIVEAKNERARDFYLRNGFVLFPDHPSRLFLLMRTIERAFGARG